MSVEPPSKPSKTWLVRSLGAAVLLIIIIAAGLHQDDFFMFVRQSWEAIKHFYQLHPILTLLLYISLLAVTVALFIPVSAALMLFGGALFSFLPAVMIISAANTLGALISFLIARHYLYAPVTRRFSHQLEGLRLAIARDGAFYLVLLRLTPLIPAFAINLMMGILPMRVHVFTLATLIGTLPVIAFYSWIGERIPETDSINALISPRLLATTFAFALLVFICKILISRRQNQHSE